MNFEVTYYNHKVKGAIQSEDIQALLNACIAAGRGTDPTLCAPFSRIASGDLRPPKNFLQNLAQITTNGVDLKATWAVRAAELRPPVGPHCRRPRVNDYKAEDKLGLIDQRPGRHRSPEQRDPALARPTRSSAGEPLGG